MKQRRLRLGDILDDYCPRERRITNHAVVAMIEDEVKQTRCTTCNADHEYKQAKVPAPRRPKPATALFNEVVEGAPEARPVLAGPSGDPSGDPSGEPVPPGNDEREAVAELFDTSPGAETVESIETPQTASPEPASPVEDEGPVHRRLIRATLPRPEGQAPDRKGPDFTIRQPSGRGREFDVNRNGHRFRGHRQGKQAHGKPGGQPSSRFGGPRHGGPGSGSPQGQRHGNRPGGPGNTAGQRGSRPGGQGRGPRQGSGPGRKRGR